MNAFKIVLIVIIIIVILCLCFIPIDLKHQKAIKNIFIKEVSTNNLADGQYTGEFKKYRWKYKVAVDIKDHKIVKISFDNESLLNSYSKKVIDKVIKDQKIDIDTVSGATINDKAILKAIEDALK